MNVGEGDWRVELTLQRRETAKSFVISKFQKLQGQQTVPLQLIESASNLEQKCYEQATSIDNYIALVCNPIDEYERRQRNEQLLKQQQLAKQQQDVSKAKPELPPGGGNQGWEATQQPFMQQPSQEQLAGGGRPMPVAKNAAQGRRPQQARKKQPPTNAHNFLQDLAEGGQLVQQSGGNQLAYPLDGTQQQQLRPMDASKVKPAPVIQMQGSDQQQLAMDQLLGNNQTAPVTTAPTQRRVSVPNANAQQMINSGTANIDDEAQRRANFERLKARYRNPYSLAMQELLQTDALPIQGSLDMQTYKRKLMGYQRILRGDYDSMPKEFRKPANMQRIEICIEQAIQMARRLRKQREMERRQQPVLDGGDAGPKTQASMGQATHSGPMSPDTISSVTQVSAGAAMSHLQASMSNNPQQQRR